RRLKAIDRTRDIPVILAMREMQQQLQAHNLRLQQEVSERQRAEAALHETTLDAINRPELNDLLEALITRAGQLLGTAHGYISLVTPDEKEIECKVCVGLPSIPIGERLKAGEGLAGKVWQTGQPLVVDDYDD